MKFAATLVIACALHLTPSAFAQGSMPATGDVDSVIQYRQGTMETIGSNAGAIAAIIQGKVPYSNSLAEHAQILATATGWVPDSFRQNTTGKGKEKTKATEKIWKDWAKFDEKSKNLQVEAQKVAKLAAAGDTAGVGKALGPLFKACKSCHEDYKSK